MEYNRLWGLSLQKIGKLFQIQTKSLANRKTCWTQTRLARLKAEIAAGRADDIEFR
jgi:hypothetical protein